MYASLAVVPYYVRPSEQAIVRHFQLIAERSPVPVVLYNIPYRTGRGLGRLDQRRLPHWGVCAGQQLPVPQQRLRL